MAASPFSGSVLILNENTDGIGVTVYHWDNVPDGTPIPPIGSIAHQIFNSNQGSTPYTFFASRQATSRADLIAKITTYVNAKFPDTST